METHKNKEHTLYPMLPTDGTSLPSCSTMVDLLEETSKRIVGEWSSTVDELEAKKSEADQVRISSGGNQEERSKMLSDVTLLQQRMQFKLKEYKTLVQMAVGLFKNLSEVEKMGEILDKKQTVYRTMEEVELAVKDHQVIRNTVAELIKITRQEAQQLIRLLEDQVINLFALLKPVLKSCFIK